MRCGRHAELPAGRIFRLSAMGGRLHLSDIGDHAPWNAGRLTFQEREMVKIALASGIGDFIANTPGELDAALEASKGKPRSQTVWAHESLMDEARSRWEAMKRDLP